MQRSAAEIKARLTALSNSELQVIALEQTASAQQANNRPGQQLQNWVSRHTPASLIGAFGTKSAPAKSAQAVAQDAARSPRNKVMTILNTMS